MRDRVWLWYCRNWRWIDNVIMWAIATAATALLFLL